MGASILIDLSSQQGKVLLKKLYFEDEKSLQEIATELDSYAMTVKRAMLSHGFTLRTKSEAQRLALANGKSSNPVKGPRTKSEKKSISKGVRKKWESGGYDKKKYEEEGKKRYNDLAKEEKEKFNRDGVEGLRKLSRRGSSFKKIICERIKKKYKEAAINEEVYINGYLVKPSIWMPKENLAISVLTAHDIHPIFGDESLQKKYKKINEAKKAVLSNNGTMIWIRNERRETSRAVVDEAIKSIISLIEHLLNNPKPIGDRFVQLEV